jgi:hypothetical protein
LYAENEDMQEPPMTTDPEKVIREAIADSYLYSEHKYRATAALDQLVAENERLRGALEKVLGLIEDRDLEWRVIEHVAAAISEDE